MRKKSQMELIGIAIVVVLVSLGMLYVVSFNLSSKQSKLKQTYTHTELASNSLSAMLKTKAVQCGDVTITELLQDCVRGASINCNGTNSCDYANETINFILNATLIEYDKAYNFSVSQTNISFLVKNCSRTLTYKGNDWESIESSTFPIPLDPGTILVKLDICS